MSGKLCGMSLTALDYISERTMPTSTTNTASTGRKFDPTKYNESDMSKHNGKYASTDYQAALEVRKFMKDNEKILPDGKLSYQNIWEGASSGKIGANGKSIDLTEKQKAAFEKFAANDFALFNRLSDGNQLSIPNIEDGIRNSRKLHGSQASDKGHWKDPVGSTTGADAKKTLADYFGKQFGEDWSEVSTKTIEQIANNGRYYDQDKKNWVKVDDPKVIEAAVWLNRNSGEVDKGGGNSLGWISRSEFDNWNKV